MELVLETNEQHTNLIRNVIDKDDVDALHVDYLAKGMSPNIQLKLNHSLPMGIMSILEVSIERGAIHCVRRLLEEGADPNFGGRCGRVPLIFACKQPGQIGFDMIKELLKRKVDVNRKYVNGNTALLEAAVQNDFKKVNLLIEAKSDVFATNNGGDTALHLASIRGNTQIVKKMLESGLQVNIRQSMGPSRAAFAILQNGSIANRDPLSVSFVRNAGIAPLHFTAYGPKGGHVEVAKILIESGADIDAKMENGRTTLHLCAMRNAFNVAELLIEKGCQIDPVSDENLEHKTPLLKAVDSKHIKMVEILINAGADINSPDQWGITPLITAIFSDQVDIAQLLLQSGCDIEQKCTNGMSPLMAALRRKSACFVKMLILCGCVLPYIGEAGIYILENMDMFDNPKYELCHWPDDDRQWLHLVLTTPPLLSIICRKTVRRNLHNCINEKISSLPIPVTLKNHLALAEFEDIKF